MGYDNATTKKQAFAELLEIVSSDLSCNGCNDFTVANTPELFLALEEAGARNLHLTLGEFRASGEYADYKPNVSKDGQQIYTQDYTILEMIRHELGLDDGSDV